MLYDLPLYRPPSEGDNLIVQVTLGCSYNQCSFCAMYKDKDYRALPLPAVFADIDQLSLLYPQAHRVFLADGDALTLPTDHLLAIADRLAARFPNLQRISTYATPIGLLRKSDDELARLKSRRLSLVYVGIESGSAEVLRRIAKGVSVENLVLSLVKARRAGLKISATVILGLAGKRLADEHILATADLINRAPPHFLSTLQLILPDTVAAGFLRRWEGEFVFQDDRAILAEQRLLIASLSPPRPVIFRSNHASNCLALEGTLPKDQTRLLTEIDQTMDGDLRPNWMRGL
ncbi:radical SAM protein [Telmatospirillum sp.]|uniref:radical SAM protein n=1 Tax=Telmatospirillum sp. TaxID=2079197 RepID=UPI00284EC01B|nr:radical SAM protein [Telmatospirillum sp.]MDR3438149.1 radical SAM protein [Telmatospirillum sp.]